MPPMTIQLELGDRRPTMVLDLDPDLDRGILGFLQSNMLYEPDIGQAMLRILRPGDTAIDVGANIGFFTVLMGVLVEATGRVISFEPGEDNIIRLRRQIALTQLNNVTLVPKPVSEKIGPAAFYLNSDSGGGHALWDPAAFPGNLRSKAEQNIRAMTTTTLDATMEQFGSPFPRLIKIDTEGAEHAVLQGARSLLEGRKVPFVIAELHEFGLQRLGSSQSEMRQFMAGFGYDTFGLYFDGSMPKLIPPNTRLQPANIINLLFSTVDQVEKVWPVEQFDPRATYRPD